MGLTFIDWFAGIGGFRRGMELAGHKCIGFCEFDKFAVMSYTSMHLITKKQRDYLLSLPLKQRRKEILKEEYKNGEWYANDVRAVDARDVPKADCWCFGFPCQDISVAGKCVGFAGKRSSLFFAITRLIRDTPEKDRPCYLFVENVKNLLSINRGFDFAQLLIELDEIGYDAEWDVLDSQHFGAPQHRERVFLIGHLRGGRTRKVFPLTPRNLLHKETRREICETARCLTAGYGQNRQGSFIRQIGNLIEDSGYKNRQTGRVYSVDGLAPTLCGSRGGGHEPKIVIPREEKTRKLTPLECFRLQGWTDNYFYRAAMVNSDNQLYKQSGNSVTVPVVHEIARRLSNEEIKEVFEFEEVCEDYVEIMKGQKIIRRKNHENKFT